VSKYPHGECSESFNEKVNSLLSRLRAPRMTHVNGDTLEDLREASRVAWKAYREIADNWKVSDGWSLTCPHQRAFQELGRVNDLLWNAERNTPNDSRCFHWVTAGCLHDLAR
jgi:hypothetical protein